MAPAPAPRRRAAVWAINELARHERWLITRVLTAFDRLKRAQTQARPTAMREATVTLATRRRLDATLRENGRADPRTPSGVRNQLRVCRVYEGC